VDTRKQAAKRRKTETLTGDFCCPISGCNIKCFETEDKQKEHVETQTGQGRVAHGIVFLQTKPAPMTITAQSQYHSNEKLGTGGTNQAPRRAAKQRVLAPRGPTPPLPSNQPDIRTFFQSNRPAPSPPNKQTDIRSFFQPVSNKTKH